MTNLRDILNDYTIAVRQNERLKAIYKADDVNSVMPQDDEQMLDELLQTIVTRLIGYDE